MNSQELECAQLKTVAQTKHLGYEHYPDNVYKAYNVINPYYREK